MDLDAIARTRVLVYLQKSPDLGFSFHVFFFFFEEMGTRDTGEDRSGLPGPGVCSRDKAVHERSP